MIRTYSVDHLILNVWTFWNKVKVLKRAFSVQLQFIATLTFLPGDSSFSVWPSGPSKLAYICIRTLCTNIIIKWRSHFLVLPSLKYPHTVPMDSLNPLKSVINIALVGYSNVYVNISHKHGKHTWRHHKAIAYQPTFIMQLQWLIAGRTT